MAACVRPISVSQSASTVRISANKCGPVFPSQSSYNRSAVKLASPANILTVNLNYTFHLSCSLIQTTGENNGTFWKFYWRKICLNFWYHIQTICWIELIINWISGWKSGYNVRVVDSVAVLLSVVHHLNKEGFLLVLIKYIKLFWTKKISLK